MVLIISEENDLSTHDVIDWLIYNEMEYLIINENTVVSVHRISLKNKSIEVYIKCNNVIINLSKISGFWYRRHFLLFEVSNEYSELNYYYNWENKGIVEFIIKFLEQRINFVGNYNETDISKIVQLNNALSVNLLIPHTHIVNNVFNLSNYNNLITKSIQGQILKKIKSYTYNLMTNKVKKNDITSYHKENFFPTLFQEEIKKKYELRIFYLFGKCYSMAIFSQNDKQTEVDFRKYNQKTPNRFIPYKLPYEIVKKIRKFMEKMELNTGSIDIIVDNKNNYWFLEVNPVGQFSMTTIRCNYKTNDIIYRYLQNEKI